VDDLLGSFRWYDALCINQEDNQEKAVQVRMMTRIYESASHVVASLGEANAESHHALQTLLQIAATNELSKMPSSIQRIGHDWYAGVPSRDDNVWDEISALIRRPWFARVWIIQEIAVSKEVVLVCGDDKISWRWLVVALNVIKHHWGKYHYGKYGRELDINTPPFQSKCTSIINLGAHRHYIQQSRRDNLLNLVTCFSYAGATDPRDHLFALLGLARDGDQEGFRPNYELSYGEISRRYAATFIDKGQAVGLLSRAGIGNNEIGLPSWIPNWSEATKTPLSQTFNHFKAAGDHKFSAKLHTKSWMLEVKGKIVDTIARVTSNTAGDVRSIYRVFEELDEIFHNIKSYPTGQDPSDIEWRLLVADLDAWGSKLPASPREMPIFGWYKTYRKYLQEVYAMDDNELEALNEDTDNSTWSQRKWDFAGLKAFSQGYWDALRRVFDNTGLGCLGTTERGYVGVFPINT
jgi:hypothetical protein